MRRLAMTWVAAAAWLVAMAVPEPAQACGGFFCQGAPMNQAGENIVFAVEADGTLTTHIQILYSGTSDGFAWILPVPSLPTLSVGTDVLFQRLAASTRPRFPLSYTATGTCRSAPYCPWGYGSGVDGGPVWDTGAPSFADASPDAARSVTVVLREAVGPYDAVVLSAGDAAALRAWLTSNAYDLPPASAALLDDYVARGNYFLALKLTKGRDAGEVQPIVLRYTESQPCIPIRLTAIATVANMPITAYVLGAENAAPVNYMRVLPVLDDASLWLGGGIGYPRYRSLVDSAVDDAGGRGFVTEYAGAVPSLSFALGSIDDLRTQTDPRLFLGDLQRRGFTGDSQLLALLGRFIPAPTPADATWFYNCMVNDWCRDFDAYLSTLPFDPAAFVDALNEAIVTPRREAEAMLGRHAKLTRMFTTMSAADMTEDPVFDLFSTVPDVSNIHTATLVTECGPAYFPWSAPQRLVLPSGRSEQTRAGVAYFGSDEQYCEDRAAGSFGPGVSVERARATAARRRPRTVAGGGAACSVAAGSSGPGLLGGLGLGLIALLVVHRRRRPR